jgi:hypothetical protein
MDVTTVGHLDSEHFIANCNFLANDIAKGKIEFHDNGARVDSQRFLSVPYNVSLKDWLDIQWWNWKQLVVKNLSKDWIIDAMPSGIVTLQSNRNV